MKADFDKTAEESIQPDTHSVEPSIQEQILFELIKGLKDEPEFPPELLEQVIKLGERNQLQKAAEVTKAIKSSGGGPHEAA